MDEMKIQSQFITGLISKVIKKKFKQKTGYDVDIRIRELKVMIADGRIRATVDLDCDAEQGILSEFIK